MQQPESLQRQPKGGKENWCAEIGQHLSKRKDGDLSGLPSRTLPAKLPNLSLLGCWEMPGGIFQCLRWECLLGYGESYPAL